MKKIAAHILFLISLTGLLGGCSLWGDEPQQPEKRDIPVRFSLNTSDPAPRLLLPAEEELIETIDVLAFIQDGANYRYSYRRQGTKQSNTNFTVDLISYNKKQILVVLVNAREELANAGILLSDNMEQALGKIIVESTNEWPAKNDVQQTFRAIPMTGISTATTITEGMTVFPETISLVRMLARIDITLKQDDENTTNGVHNFELKNARIFNRVTKGYAGYKPADWDNKIAWVPGDADKAYAPTVTYTADGSGIASNIKSKIYTLESKGVTLADYLESTAIVVGGIYTPPSGPPKTCYYRIDLTPNGLLGNTAVDIVRTHRYDIEIQSVSYPGAETPEDAYEGVVTLSAEVKDWTQNKSGVVVDGQFSLKMSQPTVNMGAKGNTITITAETNYDGSTGYPAGIISLNTTGMGTWSRASIAGSGGLYTITVVVDDIPSGFSNDSRWTSFQIKAANMIYRMEVFQWKPVWLSSNVQPNYAPGSTRHSIQLTSTRWYTWKLDQIDDPDNILFDGNVLLGLTGGGNGNSEGTQIDYIYFYVRANASPGKTATLTFIDTKGDNKPLVINIKTP
ncbi:FimB/Mfa2 family fimbrial subunit [Alistipes sp. OttesenSCG-928-L06]|nr:FimB/Mfa2 family fimbrial subunit [Alistipes sp. OttesenSCG-928-L06]